MWNLMNAARELAPVAREFPAHPVRVLKALPDEWRQRMQHTSVTDADFDPDWLQHLHELLGAPWPCPEVKQSQDLMAEVGKLLTEKGFGTGLHTYGWYSDADIDMITMIWCAVRHKQPEVVLETGVAHGVSSRVILEGLNLNDRGHLWSIDIPNPLDRSVHGQEGAAVTDECRPRWTYVEGESRLRMPPLVKEVGKVDLFIHDSLHTYENEHAELELGAGQLAADGVLLSDNAHATRALADVCSDFGLRYFEFRERPLRHFYPGGAMGAGRRG